jgi:hypothetical protein
MAIMGGKQKGATVEPDIEELLDELEQRLERLKVLYEQYFMGIEKMEPHTARKEVTRKMLELQQMHIRNTALRYRFNSLNQRLSTYVTYWNRTLRAIENGTYIRQVARVGRDALRSGADIPDEVLRTMPEKMRERVLREREKVAARAAKQAETAQEKAAAQAAKAPPGSVHQLEADDVIAEQDAEFEEAFGGIMGGDAKPAAAKPAAAAPPPAAPRPTPPPVPTAPKPAPRAAPALPPGMDERAAQELFKRLVQAKRLVGESTENLRYEQIVATIAKQAPAIMAQHKAKGVEFSVVIKDDKVILKATPKK